MLIFARTVFAGMDAVRVFGTEMLMCSLQTESQSRLRGESQSSIGLRTLLCASFWMPFFDVVWRKAFCFDVVVFPLEGGLSRLSIAALCLGCRGSFDNGNIADQELP